MGDVPFIEIHVGFLADQVAVAATDALDLGQGIHDFLLAIDLEYLYQHNALIVRVAIPSLANLFSGVLATAGHVRWC